MSPQGLPSEIDTSKAHPARLYDYFLGGKDNYEADRQAAEEALKAHPSLRTAARANRQFMHRATRWCGRQGIRQFLDIGTGIPTEPNLHQIAQAEDPSARIVYVDNDPIVLAHADALLRSTPEGRTTYIHGDVRRPRDILDSPELHETLDFSEPVALSLHALMHFVLDDEDPLGLVRELLAPLCPGSLLVLSHATPEFSPEEWAHTEKVYRERGARLRVRRREDFIKFFEGLDLVEPGLVMPYAWHPDGPADPEFTEIAVSIWAGVARKP